MARRLQRGAQPLLQPRVSRPPLWGRVHILPIAPGEPPGVCFSIIHIPAGDSAPRALETALKAALETALRADLKIKEKLNYFSLAALVKVEV